MKKSIIFNQLYLVVFVAVILVFSTGLKAQQAEKVFKVGDRVEVNIANDIQNENRWIKGTVTQINYTDDGRILSYMVRQDGSYVMQFGNLARVIRPLNEVVTEKQETKPVIDRENQTNTGETADENNENTECSFEEYPAVKANDKFSNSLIKNVLYERYASQANTGSLSSPAAVGVTFLSIKIGNSYTNTVTNTVRGPQRKQDGAPVNATIYPFSAKYIVCKKYAKETVKTQYESDFVCFRDSTGNWNCPVDGVPKITYPK